jgi:hypothetical protein
MASDGKVRQLHPMTVLMGLGQAHGERVVTGPDGETFGTERGGNIFNGHGNVLSV